jgi:DNA helicase-2/ATP-dependent DNA helicase PcrA
MSTPLLRAPGELRELVAGLDPQRPVRLTDEQLAAATAPAEPGVIVAGAGSGKTTVMAARVAWLVGTGQVSPEQVLGLTFTNKAAGELAGRVRDVLALAGARLGREEPAGEPTVATYHSFAGQLLSEHGLRIGVEPDARLLADATRFLLAQRVVRRAPGPFAALTGTTPTVVRRLIGLDGECAEHLVPTDELRAYDEALIAAIEGGGKLPAAVRDVVTTARARVELSGLVDDYRAAKRARGAVDFGDQLALAARLAAECPDVGAALRERFGVVLLDEYQDTSVAQRRMLAGLFGGGHPVTAVGDPCQSIYGWRGASVANLDDFPVHFPTAGGAPAPTYPLRESRRCGGRLLTLANTVSTPLREHHHVDELRPRAGAEQDGDAACGLFETYAEDLAWAAEQARAAVDAGTPAREVAVLVRARSDFAAVRAALVAEGLPVEVVGLGGLLALPEVADVVATLELVADPTANAAMVRLLTGPRWRIGPRDLALLGRRAQRLVAPDGGAPDAEAVGGHVPGSYGGAPDRRTADGDGRLQEAVAGVDPVEIVALADALDRPGPLPYSAEARERFGRLAAELRGLRRHAGEPLTDLVQRVLTTTGLDVEVAASPQAADARRGEALESFLGETAAFEALDGDASLPGFLGYLRAADDYDNGLDATQPSGADAVKLLTAHKAKGLEWDVVVLPALAVGVFPTGRAPDRWTSRPERLPFGLRGDADSQPTVPEWTTKGLSAFHAALASYGELEERRLGYVAMTRARRLLVASGHWWGPTQVKPRGPSPFLDAIREHCEAGHGRVERWADRPVDGARNPALDVTAVHRWPVELEPAALAARRAAAAWVRDDIHALDAGPSVPGPVAGAGPAGDAGSAAAGGTAAGEPADGGGSLADDERAQLSGWDRDVDLLLAELAEADSRSRDVELPRTLSASQLMRLRADPDGLARDLARPMPRPPAPAARRGTRLHAWVQAQFGQRPLLGPADLPGGGDAGDDAEADLEELQQAFLASEYAGRVPVAVEAPFQLVLDGRVVRGRIDAVYATGDGFEVVDWKTGRSPADPTQLAIYRLAWARLRGVAPERVTAAFCHLADGGRVERPPLAGEPELAGILAGSPGLTGPAP